MVIYDDPAVALIYAIVEGSTDSSSSDDDICSVIDNARRKFQLTKDSSINGCYYGKYSEYMPLLYIHKFTGGTTKDFCLEHGLPYTSICTAYKFYNQLNE